MNVRAKVWARAAQVLSVPLDRRPLALQGHSWDKPLKQRVRTWVFYPLMDRGLRRMPRCAADGLFSALLGIYAFSALLHFMYLGDMGIVVGDFEM